MKDFEFQSYQMMPQRQIRRMSAPLNGSILVGLAFAGMLLVFGAFSGGSPVRFLNAEGLLLVLGGTLASTLIQFSISDVRAAIGAGRAAIVQDAPEPRERMEFLLTLSRQVKEKGILTIEEEATDVTDEFLRLGLNLVVDGQAIDDIKRILTTEMRSSTEQAWRSVQVWETMGNFAPAMGLIGTLIGLIQMLGSLQDAGTVGPSMAMALVATLYGSVSANLFFFPMAGKLRILAQEREQCKSITLEGLMSIARLENPMMLEQRLQSFAALAANAY
jgi:chemotaxis protein MotA